MFATTNHTSNGAFDVGKLYIERFGADASHVGELMRQLKAGVGAVEAIRSIP